MDFKKSIPLLDALLNIELPRIHFKTGCTDIDRYKSEVIEITLKDFARE